MIFPRQLLTATSVAATVVLLTSCATLPTNNAPQALRTFDAATEMPTEMGPEPDAEADLLLRDFYVASAHPVSDYAAARSYLTADANGQWNPENGPLIVDRLNITATAGGDANERAFTIRGRLVGRLSDGGAYETDNAAYEATIVMTRVDGQWRVSSLPEEIVIERTELLNHYEPHDLFFYNSNGRTLIPDRRWVYSSRDQSLDTVLISMLMEGPSEKIAPATATADASASGHAFSGYNNGVYTFTGFQDFDADERLRFGAQLTWTLSYAGLPGPYPVALDDAPVADGYEELTTEDFADLNPRLATTKVAPLYALTEGRVLSVVASEASPVEGQLGTMGDIAAADITSEGAAAAVRRQGNEMALLVGRVDGPMQEILRADSLTRPSFGRPSSGIWTVTGGDTVVRVSQSTASGEFVESEVDTSQLSEENRHMSELQVSPSGARVAMLSEGRLFVGIVATQSNDVPAIVNVEEYAVELDGSSLAVEWNPDGSLVVGTANPDTPVWRVELDGSVVTPLPASNIVAPVVAVAASPSTVYATDGMAMRQLSADGISTGSSWRDIPGLRGVRSAPIVAN